MFQIASGKNFFLENFHLSTRHFMNAKQRRKALRKESRLMVGPHLHIHNWEELSKVPPSRTHRIEVDPEMGNGYIYARSGNTYDGHYLSTHTFYGSQHYHSTRLLRKCGFNVTIDNWDKKEKK